jgi:hypothetical protein
MSSTNLQHRHKTQNLSDGLQVVLPSKKNALWTLWLGICLFMWGYITGSIGYILFLSLRIIGVNLVRNQSAVFSDYVSIIFVSIFTFAFLLLFLVMGLPAIYSFLWHIAGKEILRITSDSLTLTRQIFNWKKVRKYSPVSITGLQFMPPRKSFLVPFKNLRKNPEKNGVIVFEHESRNHRFGLEIEEDEAKQIISAIQEHLVQVKAG